MKRSEAEEAVRNMNQEVLFELNNLLVNSDVDWWRPHPKGKDIERGTANLMLQDAVELSIFDEE